MKKILFALATAGLFSSCAVNQEIKFNSNYSGSVTMSIDMSGLAAFDEEGDMMDGLEENYHLSDIGNEVDGITNYKVVTLKEEYKININYDFTNLKALNDMLSYEHSVMNPDSTKPEGAKPDMHVFFTQKGKTLNYKEPKMTTPADESTEDMEAMDEFFTFSFAITTPKKVKKVKSESKVDFSENRVEWTRKISTMNAEKPFSFTVSM